jgi:hypothetical protein
MAALVKEMDRQCGAEYYLDRMRCERVEVEVDRRGGYFLCVVDH